MSSVNKNPVEYKWSQTLQDASLFLELETNIKSKDVKVSIREKFLAINIKNVSKMEGELFAKVNTENSTWFIG